MSKSHHHNGQPEEQDDFLPTFPEAEEEETETLCHRIEAGELKQKIIDSGLLDE